MKPSGDGRGLIVDQCIGRRACARLASYAPPRRPADPVRRFIPAVAPGGRMSTRNACRLLVILTLATVSGDAARAADEAPIGRGVGRTVPDFTLPEAASGRA